MELFLDFKQLLFAKLAISQQLFPSKNKNIQVWLDTRVPNWINNFPFVVCLIPKTSIFASYFLLLFTGCYNSIAWAINTNIEAAMHIITRLTCWEDCRVFQWWPLIVHVQISPIHPSNWSHLLRLRAQRIEGQPQMCPVSKPEYHITTRVDTPVINQQSLAVIYKCN